MHENALRPVHVSIISEKKWQTNKQIEFMTNFWIICNTIGTINKVFIFFCIRVHVVDFLIKYSLYSQVSRLRLPGLNKQNEWIQQ